jgi:uncharacterized protein (TIGR03000 family)
MYSVVLLIAATSGGDAAALGRHHHSGCCGGYSSPSCCGGSYSGYSSSNCCGGSYSGYSYGYSGSSSVATMPAAGTTASGDQGTARFNPVKPEDNKPTTPPVVPGPCPCCPPPPPCGCGNPYGIAPGPVMDHGTVGLRLNAAQRATIVVTLPADAKLYFDEAPTESTSGVRVFLSPPLPSGRDYTYTLRAEVPVAGKVQVVTQEISVRAGDETKTIIDAPIATAAAK